MATLFAWAVDTAIPGSPQPAIPSSPVRYLVAVPDSSETWTSARARLATNAGLTFLTAAEAAAGYSVTILEATPPDTTTGDTLAEGYTSGTYDTPETGQDYAGQTNETTIAEFPAN